tara:strand:+ start:82 stop:426 length:345 start_codon:yes stop_codon:yes gene_type:complete
VKSYLHFLWKLLSLNYRQAEGPLYPFSNSNVCTGIIKVVVVGLPLGPTVNPQFSKFHSCFSIVKQKFFQEKKRKKKAKKKSKKLEGGVAKTLPKIALVFSRKAKKIFFLKIKKK